MDYVYLMARPILSATLFLLTITPVIGDETDLERLVELYLPPPAETATVIAAPVFGQVNATASGRDLVWLGAADVTFLREGYIAVGSGGYGRGRAETYAPGSHDGYEYKRGWLSGYLGKRLFGGPQGSVYLGGLTGLGRSVFNEERTYKTDDGGLIDRLKIDADEVTGFAVAGFAAYWADKYLWSTEMGLGWRYTVARYFHGGPELRAVTRHRLAASLSCRFNYRLIHSISFSAGVEYCPNLTSGGEPWQFEYRDGKTVSDERVHREFAFWFGPSLTL